MLPLELGYGIVGSLVADLDTAAHTEKGDEHT